MAAGTLPLCVSKHERLGAAQSACDSRACNRGRDLTQPDGAKQQLEPGIIWENKLEPPQKRGKKMSFGVISPFNTSLNPSSDAFTEPSYLFIWFVSHSALPSNKRFASTVQSCPERPALGSRSPLFFSCIHLFIYFDTPDTPSGSARSGSRLSPEPAHSVSESRSRDVAQTTPGLFCFFCWFCFVFVFCLVGARTLK